VNSVSVKPSILGKENEPVRRTGEGDEVGKGLDEGAPCVASHIGGRAPCASSSSVEELGASRWNSAKELGAHR
jgi:hypothetical protein